MKISNSKKQLAKIISENGGWREGALWSTQDSKKDDFPNRVCFYQNPPRIKPGDTRWLDGGLLPVVGAGITATYQIHNWHQTVLSRDEYFHLYPAPEADGWIEWKGGECPVLDESGVARRRDGVELAFGKRNAYNWRQGKSCPSNRQIVAYRLHKPEIAPDAHEPNPVPAPEAKPTIEQLAADYRNSKDFADRKQQEADDAKADAEAKLADLVAAGKAVGLVVSVAAPEPELIITDWWDLQEGDEVECLQINITGGDYADDRIGSTGIVVATEEPGKSGQAVKMRFDDGKSYWVVKWRFIRRPAKGDANAWPLRHRRHRRTGAARA